MCSICLLQLLEDGRLNRIPRAGRLISRTTLIIMTSNIGFEGESRSGWWLGLEFCWCRR